MIPADRIDTRIRQSILTDPRFIADISAEEFRAYWLLMVWVVGRISDGAFSRRRALATIPLLTADHLDTLVGAGLIEAHGDDCLMVDFEQWQTSRAELEKLDQRREQTRVRVAKHRAAQVVATPELAEPTLPEPDDEEPTLEELAAMYAADIDALYPDHIASHIEPAPVEAAPTDAEPAAEPEVDTEPDVLRVDVDDDCPDCGEFDWKKTGYGYRCLRCDKYLNHDRIAISREEVMNGYA